MRIVRLFCVWLILFGLTAEQVQANWMIFTGGGTTSTGVWPAGSVLSGTAVANANNFINGNNPTSFIGLTPITVGPALSTDYVAIGLQPNTGNLVHSLGTPYSDDAEMRLFKTTQDVKTIDFDMEVGVGGNSVVGGYVLRYWRQC